MKKFIIIIFVLILISKVHAQKWDQLIGLPNRDEYGGKTIEHYDKGYLLSATLQKGSGNYHGWVVKTDINGELMWDKQIGLFQDKTTITGILYDELGNIYTFGWLYSQNFAHEFPFIVKLNACGEKLWCRLFALEGYSYGFFNDVIIIENGDLLCLAIMPEDDPTNNNRILLFRLTSEGEFLWKKGYATHEDHPYYGDPYGATLNQFGNQYIISGTVYSPYPHDPNPYHVWQRPMFLGIDEEFEEQWILEFGINDSILGKAYGTYQLNDSVFMGFGTNRYAENGYITDNSLIMYYNRDGIETGHHIIDGSDIAPEINQNFIDDIERIDQTRFLCAAGIGEDYQGCPYSEMVIDTAGIVHNYTLQENTWGGANYVTKSFDDKFILAASHELPSQTTSDILLYKIYENLEQDTLYPGYYAYDSLCKKLPIQSEIIDLGDCYAITGIGEIPTLEQYNKKMQSIGISASPNPSNSGEILLEYENTESFTNLELHITDVYGKPIHREAVLPHQGATRLSTNSWPAGMYIATIMSNGQMRGKCKILVE